MTKITTNNDLSGFWRVKKNDVVAVGLSGGVDSYQAAWKLQERGFKLTSFYLKLFSEDSSMEKAQEAASKLSIPFQVIDLTVLFEKHIVSYFIQEYQNGRTPSPCIKCNQLIKFGFLWQTAKKLGADFLATGHYAGLSFSPQALISRPLDKEKDQSYFLSRLSSQQLNHVVFPLANVLKNDIKVKALAQGYKVGKDSQEICFINGDYRDFLKQRLGSDFNKVGDFIDKDGKAIAKHRGIGHYTIGQRRGLNVPGAHPYYVSKILPETNQVMIGKKEDLLTAKLNLNEVVLNFVKWPENSFNALVQIRSGKQAYQAELIPKANNILEVNFAEPQKAITSGQGAAIYQDDLCLGGGWII